MTIGSTGRQVKFRGRAVLDVPPTSGNYGTAVVTVGAVPDSNDPQDNFAGVTVLLEAGSAVPTGAVVELWLPRLSGIPDNAPASGFASTEYHPSGQVIGPVGTALTVTGGTANFGSLTYALAGYPGCQVRVKSAGVPGNVVVSVTAF